jgi:hypothetical protein
VRIASASDGAPEVVVKVVSPGSNNLMSIQRHFEELQNGKDRAMETDLFATPVRGKEAARALIKNWGLDADELIYQYLKHVRRTPRKLVHKIIFSMPVGTSPERLLAAVRNFGQEEFQHEHRYALALHTDEPHPHVHMVVRAMKQGKFVRLNIRKPLLRKWREAFARHLSAQGVAAKATSWTERHRQFPDTPRSLLKRPRWSNQSKKLEQPRS